MSTLRNRVQLIGHLGNDPEIIETKSGSKMAKFSLATNDFYKDKNGNKVENTEWHNIVAWGKKADLAESYLAKGKEVMLVGRLSYNKYETDKGEMRYFTQINVDEFRFLGK